MTPVRLAPEVMFPRLDDAADVDRAIRHLRYPPDGDRGVATYNRVYGFGLRPERLDTANDHVVGIVQVESRRALEALADIAAVPGVDVLFVGPRDLTHDLKIPGQFGAPEFRDALDQVLAVTRLKGAVALSVRKRGESSAAAVQMARARLSKAAASLVAGGVSSAMS